MSFEPKTDKVTVTVTCEKRWAQRKWLCKAALTAESLNGRTLIGVSVSTRRVKAAKDATAIAYEAWDMLKMQEREGRIDGDG